jgi:hypothetical protein
MAQASIDSLAPKRSLINLDDERLDDFGNIVTDDYILSFIFDDILLVKFTDEGDDEGQGDVVERGGIFIPVNAMQRAWRKGVVLMAGPEVKYVKTGQIVIFPSNYGVGLGNVEIKDYGFLKKGIFLNESRIFGICDKKNEGKSTKSKTKAAK